MLLHISENDALVENDVPLPALPPATFDEKDKTIGKLIADQVPDGACIQIV
jgi:itaconate CoA-transferase